MGMAACYWAGIEQVVSGRGVLTTAHHSAGFRSGSTHER